MNIPAILRVFALFLLPAFFAALLAGCGGKIVMSILAILRVFALFLLPAFFAVLLAGCGGKNVDKLTKEWDSIPGIQQENLVQAFAACCGPYQVASDFWSCNLGYVTCMASAGWKPSCLQSWKGCGGGGAVPSRAAGTALHIAAFNDNDAAAAILIAEGAYVDEKNQHGWTPLQSAIFNDSGKVAKLLIKNGANIHAVDENGIAFLHMAVKHNSRKVAGLLISKGADIEGQGGGEGLTPLHFAALFGSMEVADLLIARGGNLEAETYSGETPLDIAKREGKRDVIAVLERAVRAATRESEPDSANGGGDGAESVFENAWRSVVVVVAGDNQGGGVVVNEPNQVATNCHVVDESPNDIRVYKGENRRAVRDAPHSAEIVSEDRERDVCILSVSGLWAIPAKIRLAGELEIGESVYAVGTPKGLDFSISNGIVSQLREEAGESAPLIQTSAAISPGSSGGGLFDSQGRLVGLTTWKIREGENLNFAIPVDWALELPR